MADWQLKLDIHEEFEQAGDGELPLGEFCKIVAEKVKALVLPKCLTESDEEEYLVEERDEIVQEFEQLSEDSYITVDEVDSLIQRLYDWGDSSLDNNPSWNRKRLCWIAAGHSII